jgi:hypothetical protein
VTARRRLPFLTCETETICPIQNSGNEPCKFHFVARGRRRSWAFARQTAKQASQRMMIILELFPAVHNLCGSSHPDNPTTAASSGLETRKPYRFCRLLLRTCRTVPPPLTNTRTLGGQRRRRQERHRPYYAGCRARRLRTPFHLCEWRSSLTTELLERALRVPL